MTYKYHPTILIVNKFTELSTIEHSLATIAVLQGADIPLEYVDKFGAQINSVILDDLGIADEKLIAVLPSTVTDIAYLPNVAQALLERITEFNANLSASAATSMTASKSNPMRFRLRSLSEEAKMYSPYAVVLNSDSVIDDFINAPRAVVFEGDLKYEYVRKLNKQTSLVILNNVKSESIVDALPRTVSGCYFFSNISQCVLASIRKINPPIKHSTWHAAMINSEEEKKYLCAVCVINKYSDHEQIMTNELAEIAICRGGEIRLDDVAMLQPGVQTVILDSIPNLNEVAALIKVLPKTVRRIGYMDNMGGILDCTFMEKHTKFPWWKEESFVPTQVKNKEYIYKNYYEDDAVLLAESKSLIKNKYCMS